MKIRTLIVDDMLLARTRLRRHLSEDPDIDIIGECAGGQEAIDAIRQLAPDLLLLDVQMPEVDGFDVLAAVGAGTVPAVIFVTAYDQFALRAFEVHALDYILKPFEAERLRKTVNRAKQQLAGRTPGAADKVGGLLEEMRTQSKYPRRLAVRSDGRTVFLPVGDIDYVEAAGNYLRIQAGTESHMIRERLTQLEARLDPDLFARIHRSTIVNVDRIKEMSPLFNGDQVLILRNGKKLTLSRTFRDQLMSLLGRL
jgi:two-component system LytT family response regulator